jgi:hypothetical protein
MAPSTRTLPPSPRFITKVLAVPDERFGCCPNRGSTGCQPVSRVSPGTSSLLGDERVHQVRDRIAPVVTTLVERAKAQGVVRSDLDRTDLTFLQLGLSAIMNRTKGIEPDLYRRYLTMFLDGIRTDRGGYTPLPVRALTAHETHAAMTGDHRHPD